MVVQHVASISHAAAAAAAAVQWFCLNCILNAA
jgi:hypothetical protein